MNVIIQHNFTSGLGDFISDLTQYMTACNRLKKIGYKIHLKISLRNNKYINCPFFKSIFDEETVNFFDTIEEIDFPINSIKYENCIYYKSSHLPDIPGQHHWDIFFDILPDNFKLEIFDASKILNQNIIPEILPKLNKEILNIADSFTKKINNKYYFLHVRILDEKYNVDNIKNIIQKIKSFADSSNIILHVGSNNSIIINELKKHKNIFLFDFKYFDIINNDMNSYRYNTSKPNNELRDVLLERLKYIFAEMASIVNSDTIILQSDYVWISNFVFYSLGYNKGKQKVITLNELLLQNT